MSKSAAINRAYDLHRNMKKINTIPREVIDNLLMVDTAVNVLVNWLNGFHTICRKHIKTDMDSPVDPNYVLFVKQVFPKTHSRLGQQVLLDKTQVQVSYNQQTSLDLSNRYDLMIRLTMANGSHHLYVDQIEESPKRLAANIHCNMFDLGQLWRNGETE